MTTLIAARAATGWDRGSPQIDRLGGAIEINNAHFLEKASYCPRAWWAAEAEREGFDWPAVVSLALEIIGTTMFESDFECACRLAEEQRRSATPAQPRPRPTPQTTIEAILYCVRQRGPKALEERANIERLLRCDEPAKEQIDRRIATMEGGR